MKKTYLILIFLAAVITACGENVSDNFIDESGTAESINILLSAERSGKIKEIRFKEGNKIKQGDTLAVIDFEMLSIKLKQAKASEKMSLANFELMKKGLRKEDKNQAEENLRQAELNYSQAKKDYERYKNLIKENVITQKQFDDAETRYNINRAKLKGAKENLKKVYDFFRPEELLKAEAAFEQSLAKTAEIKKLISDSYIISPLNGTLVKSFTEVGELVNPMSSLMKISDLSNIEITIYVKETDLGKIKLGQTAKIFSDTYEEKSYNGLVSFISPEAEFTPKNVQTKDERVKLVFAVKIKAENKNEELKSGMPVDVKIDLVDNE